MRYLGALHLEAASDCCGRWWAQLPSLLVGPTSKCQKGAGLVRRFKRLKPSHKGGPPQTVVRGGTCVNRR
eukprot:COSAG01_NODE_7475_length_3195_cov_5.249031_4_plen_70_part_00